jgi:hypothetical protein
MKKLSIIALMIYSLNCLADEPKKSIMFKRDPDRSIELYLRKPNELRTNGALVFASGLMFTTIGCLLERKRMENNIPDGYFGYSRSKDIGFNYGVGAIGVGLSITGIIMIRKSF